MEIKWHNKNDIEKKVIWTTVDRYTDSDVKEDNDKVLITECHSKPCLFQLNTEEFPRYMTGKIVKYINEFTFIDGCVETEIKYGYRFYEISEPTVNSEIEFDSKNETKRILVDNIKWIYESELDQLLNGGTDNEME